MFAISFPFLFCLFCDEQYPFFPLEVVLAGLNLVVCNVAYTDQRQI